MCEQDVMHQKQTDMEYQTVKPHILASGQLSPRANYRHVLFSGVFFREIL